MQPHFALSSLFRLGLRGIEKKLKLSGPPISVLQRENKAPVRLAMSLEESTRLFMKPESIAREVLGNDFVDHYGGTREHEVKVWNEAVTNWEGECRKDQQSCELNKAYFNFSGALPRTGVIGGRKPTIEDRGKGERLSIIYVMNICGNNQWNSAQKSCSHNSFAR